MDVKASLDLEVRAVCLLVHVCPPFQFHQDCPGMQSFLEMGEFLACQWLIRHLLRARLIQPTGLTFTMTCQKHVFQLLSWD